MTINDICITKQITKSLEDARKLIFDRQIFVNGIAANSVHQHVYTKDVVKIGKYEFIVLCKELGGAACK